MKIYRIILLAGLSAFVFANVLAQAQETAYNPKTTVFVEAESFAQKGGWAVDQQFIDVMGSSVLLAHGMGNPVTNAKTAVVFPQAGTYRVFVRTRNWVATWTPEYSPGRFQLVINDKTYPTTFGTEGEAWHWQPGKEEIVIGENHLTSALELRDLTGFDGRVDAICFTSDKNFTPPNDLEILKKYRRAALGLPDVPPDAEGGPFDFVVVGGGIAGTCAAISAARLGLHVALVQDRPLVGGNNSSEVRVHLQGRINLPPYPNLGNLVAQMNHRRDGNAMPADYYEDEKKMNLLAAESGVKTFFCMRGIGVEKSGNKITAVIGKHTETGKEYRFVAPLFADCTGDGNIGYYAGADWRMGRESKAETGEPLAPDKADKMTMGASVQWYSVESSQASEFPELPWAIQFNEQTAKPMVKGDWDWETGLNFDQIWDFERIRDHGLRAAYGHWAYMKNQAGGEWAERVRNRQLGWVAFIAGKRESRRLLGDVILKEQDILERKEWDDACVTTTWGIDLHYPAPKNSKDFPGEEFMTIAPTKRVEPYAIPYRCFYSRNIENLFMAGRDISVTHVALGTIRVMRTGGMMGEVVGMAASICKKHDATPRGVYQNHLDELKTLLEEGVAPPPVSQSGSAAQPKWLKIAGKNLARDAKVKASSVYTKSNYPVAHVNDGNYDLNNNAGRWVSDNQETEHWIEFTLEKPVKINAFRVLTGQAGNGFPITPINDFVLQRFVFGQWRNIEETAVKGNKQCDFGCKFPTIETQQLRLLITATPENLARIWETEFYEIP
ncbi:MAG: FAD-dependent oxidoreductase [Planctomycetaceae bacterium]|jgi:hypothetical protein|nr:FAD-dependent oxidoreductase [Planctomycetaceae bacterium]